MYTCVWKGTVIFSWMLNTGLAVVFGGGGSNYLAPALICFHNLNHIQRIKRIIRKVIRKSVVNENCGIFFWIRSETWGPVSGRLPTKKFSQQSSYVTRNLVLWPRDLHLWAQASTGRGETDELRCVLIPYRTTVIKKRCILACNPSACDLINLSRQIVELVHGDRPTGDDRIEHKCHFCSPVVDQIRHTIEAVVSRQTVSCFLARRPIWF